MVSYDTLALSQRETSDEHTMDALLFYLGEHATSRNVNWLIKQPNVLVKNSMLDDNMRNAAFCVFIL
ncbi:hypothetical protein TY91_03405 [Secundilactobacillus collinoides]|uniref:Uncharacterized protein n=1 Tax=Secundilactobacillus collinoides TaxID=33960 RepID=A0A166HI94_SECCO|nr:hypothetical protein TY91_03405 [Secundilactobacillus collinoides]